MPITAADSLGILNQQILSTVNATTLVTVPSAKTYNKICVSCTNIHATTPALVDIFLIPSGQTAVDLRTIYKQVYIPPYATVEFVIPHDLTAGYFVQAQASVANIITCMTSANVLS